VSFTRNRKEKRSCFYKLNVDKKKGRRGVISPHNNQERINPNRAWQFRKKVSFVQQKKKSVIVEIADAPRKKEGKKNLRREARL